MSKVDIDYNVKDHACTGYVMSCSDTGRTIASFWSESDINGASDAINNHDRLVQDRDELYSFVKMLADSSECIDVASRISNEAFELINKIQGGE